MYKVVLIGLGNIAWKMQRDKTEGSSLSHKAAFDQNKQITLVAGYSPDTTELDEFIVNCNSKGYQDMNEMLEREKPDIVSICSPHEFHASQVEMCLNYKIPMIWLEKPAAKTVKDIKKLEKLRRELEYSSTILVNFQRRYTSSYQRLKKTIQKNTYGKVLSVEVNYSRGLITNGSHMLDLLSYIFPNSELELLWVEQEKTSSPSFIIKISNDLIASVVGIEASFHNIDLRVTCEKARISIEHTGMRIRVEEVKENDLYKGFYRLYDKKSDELGIAGFGHAFDYALEDLIKSYEKQTPPISNLTTAIKSQRLIEDILQKTIK